MKKILIIAESIAPVQVISAIRWSKILSYIKEEHDVEITVLTTKKNYDKEKSVFPLKLKDPYLIKHVNEYKNYYEVPFGKLCTFCYFIYSLVNCNDKTTANSPTVIRNGIDRKTKLMNELRNIESDFRDFLVAKQFKKYCRNFDVKYDVMISSYGPAWTHVIASQLKRRNPQMMWIADFRDPYAQEVMDGKWGYRRHARYTRKYCKDADVITCVNAVMDVHECEGQKKVVITNGFDPKEANPPKAPNKFLCFFSGTLYKLSNLKAFFRVVKEFVEDGTMDKNDIVLGYAGKQSQEFYGQARECQVENLVQDFGLLSRDKVLEIQSGAAILLQAGWNTKKDKIEWSGKMYEYMMAQKPIVFLMEGDEAHSEPSKYIAKVGGVCYEYCRHEETLGLMKEYVKRQYLSWIKNGDVYIEADMDYVNSYAYSSIAKKVWSVIGEESE